MLDAINGMMLDMLAAIAQKDYEDRKRRAAEATGDRRQATGDNERTARAVASKLGIDEVRAGILPEGKKTLIDQLRRDGHKIAMAGDGVNDARPLPPPMSASPWAPGLMWPWKARASPCWGAT